jgi:catechol 2,3-dioxygenase-like lactoylglutathione lyase family enzyme
MEVRVARHTEHLDDAVAFYGDGIGLPVVGEFRNHDGYDGVFLAIPGSGAHLELTAGGGDRPPAPHPESLLVLYLGGEEAVQRILARLGARPVAPANPYWARHGVTVEDPDVPAPATSRGRLSRRARVAPPARLSPPPATLPRPSPPGPRRSCPVAPR